MRNISYIFVRLVGLREIQSIFDGNPDKLTNESSTDTLDVTSHGEYSKNIAKSMKSRTYQILPKHK